MSVQSLVHVIALTALACVLLATAITFGIRMVPSIESPKLEARAARALDAELERCRAISLDAKNDAVWRAAWELNRKRLFEREERYSDKSINPVVSPVADPEARRPAKTDLNRTIDGSGLSK